MNIFLNRKAWYFLAAFFALIIGTLLSAAHYPGGFDWFYTVASALASRKHNPEGSYWFSGALVVSMALLWVSLSTRASNNKNPSTSLARYSLSILRLGLISGGLLGLERLFIYHLSDLVPKAHEALALVAFLGLYTGTIGLLISSNERNRGANFAGSTWIVIGPLIGIGITQLWLYLDQRDLGWVDTSWREMGIPIWLSFAFWQWLAMASLWLGLGLVLLAGLEKDKTPTRNS